MCYSHYFLDFSTILRYNRYIQITKERMCMLLKIQGNAIYNPLYSRIGLLDKNEVIEIEVQAQCVIQSDNAFLEFYDRYDDKYPNRPYLHITGKCKSVQCESLPYDITEVVLLSDNQIQSEIYYDFSDSEIADLAAKGLFNKGFQCPRIFYNNEYEMPVDIKVTMVKPQGDNEVPIVFVDIPNAGNIAVDSDSCGYVFADYFEQHHKIEFNKLVDVVSLDKNFITLENDAESKSDKIDEYKKTPAETPAETNYEPNTNTNNTNTAFPTFIEPWESEDEKNNQNSAEFF